MKNRFVNTVNNETGFTHWGNVRLTVKNVDDVWIHESSSGGQFFVDAKGSIISIKRLNDAQIKR